MEAPTLSSAAQDRVFPGQRCACCHTPRTGAYCALCGQHFREDEKLTFRVLWREFAARTLNFDAGLLYTVRTLFTRGPGEVAKRYVNGERRRFTSPITFLAICCAFYLVTFGLYRTEYIAFMQDTMRQTLEAQNADRPDRTPDEDVTQLQQSMQEEMPLLLSEFMIRNTLYFSLLAVIPGMLAYRLFFGPEHTLAEIAVLLLYTQSMVTLVSLVTYPAVFVLASSFIQIAGWAVIGVGFFFVLWGVARFYGRQWWHFLMGALGYAFSIGSMMLLGGVVGLVWAVNKLAEIKGVSVAEVLQRIVT